MKRPDSHGSVDCVSSGVMADWSTTTDSTIVDNVDLAVLVITAGFSLSAAPSNTCVSVKSLTSQHSTTGYTALSHEYNQRTTK